MRPQRFSCGIRKAALPTSRIAGSFNEAAAFQLRNLRETTFSGHASSASMRPQRFSCGIADRELSPSSGRGASMRPQRFSCGIVRWWTDSLLGRFPASMRPQRFSCGILLPALAGVGFAVASMRPQRFSCGIGFDNIDAIETALASMRPQRFSCGIASAQSQARRLARGGFNEAAAFQLRNPRLLTISSTRSCCFNEAAAFQLRNLRTTIHAASDRRASMRPQRFSCGISGIVVNPYVAHAGFNEAAAFQLRNRSGDGRRRRPSAGLQ